MATPETRNEEIAPAGSDAPSERADNRSAGEFALMNRLTIPIIICATPAFLVALAGAWTEIVVLVLAGGSALGLLQLIWLSAALVTLRKMAQNWFTARRKARYRGPAAPSETGKIRQ